MSQLYLGIMLLVENTKMVSGNLESKERERQYIMSNNAKTEIYKGVGY